MSANQHIKWRALALIALLAACSPKVDNHGYVNDQEWKEGVAAGKTTKQDLLEKFGSPSSVSSFGEETWYYVSARMETTAFFKPKVAKQDVVRVTFDNAGVVSNIEMYDESSSQKVKIVKRTTPTEGHSLGFVEQVIGNIGRFNKPSKEPSATAPGGRSRN